MKDYLHCTVTRTDGATYINKLKLSEVHLIKAILKEKKNESIDVRITEVTKERYESIFGKS